MKSDIEIAMEAALEPIKDVIKKVDIEEDDIDLYGKYKAKISDDLWDKIKDRPDGKLILVTIPWTMLWYEGWCCRRWLCPGCTDGRIKSSFHRRFPCYHIR